MMAAGMTKRMLNHQLIPSHRRRRRMTYGGVRTRMTGRSFSMWPSHHRNNWERNESIQCTYALPLWIRIMDSIVACTCRRVTLNRFDVDFALSHSSQLKLATMRYIDN